MKSPSAYSIKEDNVEADSVTFDMDSEIFTVIRNIQYIFIMVL